MREWFRNLATRASGWMGHPWTFAAALGLILLWALSGPLFGFNDTWQLIANTATTLVTFLTVFLVQNTQNRDSKAINLKLDELVRVSSARNIFAALEDASEAELEKFTQEFHSFRESWQRRRKSEDDTTPVGRTIP